ncbi:response regulator transcription factor [Chloroflexia bacterium SDU3-3]|nr:response regulator transcription factor [Chloroflexia bacterium SDU3-3]
MGTSPLIMMVDSDIAFLEMLAEFLGEEGYATQPLRTTSDAFSTIAQAQPQLVIVEVALDNPEQGWSLLNKLRLDPATCNIPVIVASAATDLITRNEAHLREKRCAILLKPFDLEDLLAMVKRHAPLPA